MYKIFVWIVGLLSVIPFVVSARVVELTFDDGPDGSGIAEGFGELKNAEGVNPENPTRELLKARFLWSAHRSTITEGRYGRSAVFNGGNDAIELRGVPSRFEKNSNFYAWLKVIDRSQGWVLQVPSSFGVTLNNGRIETAVYNTVSSAYQNFDTGVVWPTDGKFHMLIMHFDGIRVSVALDFITTGSTAVLPAMPLSASPWLIGYQFKGMMDELLIDSGPINELAQFDYNPSYCGGPRVGASAACLEEQIVVTPDGWPHPVPIRFKTVYDTAQCTPATPCPLVVVVSGGNHCANDYPTPRDIQAYVRNGLVAAAVDPTCEATNSYSLFPHETSQLIAVKNYLFNSSRSSPVIKKDNYYAAGCSHGAGTVSHWAFQEDDYPARTFARSANIFDIHCVYHSPACSLVQKLYDEIIGFPYPHDDEDINVEEFFSRLPTLEIVDSSITSTREYGASWGVDTSLATPACGGGGSPDCYEEGTGATYGNRRLRDAWHRNEPSDRLTGYFFEYATQDCSHCEIGDEGLACTACFLKYGREGMAVQCPSCLAKSEGGPSNSCELDLPPSIAAFDTYHIFLDRPEPLGVTGSRFSRVHDFVVKLFHEGAIKLTGIVRPQASSTVEIDLSSFPQFSALSPDFYDLELEKISDDLILTHPQGKKLLLTKLGDLGSSSGDRDGKVGILDVSRLLSKWESTIPTDVAEADINPGPNNVSQGKIDIYDANTIMANWSP